MTELCDLSVAELLDAYRRREATPLDAFLAVAARIEAWEPRLHALYAYDPEGARAAALQSSARWARGEPCGPLDGVPITIKENVATKGVPAPLGSAATILAPAPEDAPPAARLREAGCVIFAKTTMPDYGMLSSGLSSFHELARNPWDLRMNPGGSSAGAAAAAAAGYGPIHLGTDIGGSIRLPAGWCALAGMKPSHGRVPIDPPYIGRVAGPLARNVADVAAAMAVLARPDWRDPTRLPPAEIDWTPRAADPRGLRIGLVLDIGAGLPTDPETRGAVEAAAHVFAAAGAIVEPAEPALTREMLDGLDDFWRARALADMEKLPPDRRERILPYYARWAEAARELSATDAVRGLGQSFAMARAAARLFRKFDVLLSPTSPVPSFPAEAASPVDDPDTPFEHIGFTLVWNMSGQPAISVNCGFTRSGLPIGLQIVGRHFDDAGVIRLARFYETARGPQPPWPRPPASA